MPSGMSPENLRQPHAPWIAEAACRDQGVTSKFFVERGEAIWEALVFCERCTVRRECLQFALDNNIAEGVWGGKSTRARRDPERCNAPVVVPSAARVVALREKGWTKRAIARELGISEGSVWNAIKRNQEKAS